MKSILFIAALCLSTFASFAQVRNYGHQQIHLWVAPEWAKADASNGGTKAMLVKSYADARYVPLDTIEGFTFEPGYEYHLLVKSKKVAAPEGQSKAVSRYVLINIVEKTKVEAATPTNQGGAGEPLDEKAIMIEGGTWKLVDMYENETRVKFPKSQLITISFDLRNKKVRGYAFCNKWESNAVVKGYKMFLDDFAAGSNTCAQEDEEMLFFDNLAKVSEWKMKGDQLVLKKFDKVLLIFERSK